MRNAQTEDVTVEAIAEAVGVSQPTVIEWTKNFIENLNTKDFIKFNFQDDTFTPPIYNVWKLKEKTNSCNELLIVPASSFPPLLPLPLGNNFDGSVSLSERI